MGTVVALRMTGVAEEEAVSEALLLRQARKGDAKSFESLYRRHEGRVYALCLRMTRSPERAEDCTQEAFVKAWRSLPTFEGRSAFGTWLHRIAVNQVLSLQRREARRFPWRLVGAVAAAVALVDRKSTRLNSSHCA